MNCKMLHKLAVKHELVSSNLLIITKKQKAFIGIAFHGYQELVNPVQ